MITPKSSGQRSRTPADGERRAVRNLSAQYQVAATLTLGALVQGELEWVSLVDPDAGRLDDVVIARPGRLDAYQIKWSKYRGTISFNHLVTPSVVSGRPYPAPFALLAEGWQRLSAAHPARRIIAHYLTHDGASANDGGKGLEQGDPPHLQSFLRNAFPLRDRWFRPEGAIVRGQWSVKVDAVCASTGLRGPELERFLAGCELDLGFDLPADANIHSASDLRAIAAYLMDAVATSGGSAAVVISRADLLRGLGWTDRFEFRFRHEFPVDERLYRPVEETVTALEAALAAHDRGYIALVGAPGSGKSTLLTHTLRYRENTRLVRYYAFVRDDPRQGRGEAHAFLHDLCLALQSILGPQPGKWDYPDTVDGYRERLGALFGALHEAWHRTGIRTVILVDGLDHIEREQSVTRSLIEVLPAPNTVPQGVLVILGTQEVGLRSDTPSLRPILSQLGLPNRKLTMARLSRASVRSIVEAGSVAVPLRTADHDRLYELSNGHPLALAYLVQRLSAATDRAKVDAIINESVTYAGDIEADYNTYWQPLGADSDLRDLLGLACRMQDAIELDNLQALASASTLERFVARASHYFRHQTPSRWTFFHNSFRQFLLRATGQDAFGRPDPTRGSEYHRRLANLGERAPGTALAWERLLHLEAAGDREVLLSLDHQALFRAQFHAGRPVVRIIEDVERCLQAAAALARPILAVRLFLISKEVRDREEAFENVDLDTLRLRLTDPTNVADALFYGPGLAIPEEAALSVAAELLDDGRAVLAHQVFDAAEPLGLLSGADCLDATGKDEVLDAWAATAFRFRPLDQVLDAIGQVRVDTLRTDMAPPYEEKERADGAARARLLDAVGEALLERRDAELIARFEVRLTDMGRLGVRVRQRFEFMRARLGVGDQERFEEATSALDRVLSEHSSGLVEPREAVFLADLITMLGDRSERADPYLDQAASPLSVTDLGVNDGDPFQPVDVLFRQARAMAARGRTLDPVTALPDAKRDYDQGRVVFQRIVILVATVWGEALHGNLLPEQEVVRRLGPAIRLLRRSFNDVTRWHDWHYVQRAAVPLFKRALWAAKAHGALAFRALMEAFEADWERKASGLRGWAPNERREIVLEALAIDGNEDRTERILAEADDALDISFELQERVEHGRDSIIAWLQIGRQDRAQRAFEAMMRTSFGIYHSKDYQVERWSHWAARFIASGAGKQEARTAARLLARVITVLQLHHRGDGREEAASELLAALSRCDQDYAYQIGAWLLKEMGARRPAVLGGLLRGQLASSNPERLAEALVAMARLAMPFEPSSDPDLIKAVEAVVEGEHHTDFRVASALDLIRRTANTKVEHRAAYGRLLGQAERPEKQDIDVAEPHEAQIALSDGRTIGQAELDRLAADPSLLSATLSLIGKNDEVRWGRIVAALVTRSYDVATAHALALIVKRGPEPFGLERIVGWAIDNDDRRLADRAIEAVLRTSRPYGWFARYDGGTRAAAARCLLRRNPETGYNEVLALLVADHLSGAIGASDIVRHLDDIAPFLFEQVPEAAIWCEMAEHVSALAEATETTVEPPAIDDEVLADRSIPLQLLLTDLAHMSLPVAWEARRGLLDLITFGISEHNVRAALRDALKDDSQQRVAALATVACFIGHEESLNDLEEPLRALAWASSAVTRLLAQRTLEVADASFPARPARRNLPAIYKLHLPEAVMPERSLGGEAPLGGPMPDSSDPIDLSRLFHDPLRQIAAETGYSFELLARRFAQIMSSVAPPADWSAASERRLQDHLEAIGLKINFRRPRSLVAHESFGRLVAELCDADVLEWPNRALEKWLIVADPVLHVRDPSPRPEWLHVPDGKSLGAHPIEDWLSKTREALPAAEYAPNGDVIVAELTTCVSTDGSREEEARAAMMAHRELPLILDLMPDIHRFAKKSRYFASDYPLLQRLTDFPSAVVAGGAPLAGADFLAINPRLAFHLGWTPSADGLFRWVDEHGERMAESLWWQEGNPELYEYSGYGSRAAGGWLVLASPKGWAAMRPQLRYFQRLRLAGRETPSRSEEPKLVVEGDKIPLPD